jgi:autotransporter adhesin
MEYVRKRKVLNGRITVFFMAILLTMLTASTAWGFGEVIADYLGVHPPPNLTDVQIVDDTAPIPPLFIGPTGVNDIIGVDNLTATGVVTGSNITATNSTDISNNATAIGANTTAIGTNTTAIGANTTSIGTNTTAIGTNTTAIGANTTAIASINTGFSDLEEEAFSGIASVAAMASIPAPRDGNRFALGMGVGNYEGESAFAAGLSANIATNMRVTASLGFSNDNVASGVGLGFSW